MTAELLHLIEAARQVEMTKEQSEEQRISFAYGNTHFENEQITRDTVKEAARLLKGSDDAANGRTEG
jgi:hypothetical protein